MLFYKLFFNTLSIYVYIIQGFIAGRVLKINRTDIATLLFYLITPLIFVTGIARAKLDSTAMLLPVIIFFIASSYCLLTFWFGKYIWDDSSRNILAFSAGNGNASFFGVPVALMIFNEQLFGTFMTASLGIVVFENSLGYFVAAIGQHTAKECIIRLFKLPVLWGAFSGLVLNYFQVNIPSYFDGFIDSIRGAYVVLGMMVIGMGLSGMSNLKLDLKFLSVSLITKFIFWPLMILFLIYLDKNFIHLYSTEHYNIMILVAIMPLATNTVIISTLLNIFPEKMATAVVASMIIALLYIPFMITYFMVL